MKLFQCLLTLGVLVVAIEIANGQCLESQTCIRPDLSELDERETGLRRGDAQDTAPPSTMAVPMLAAEWGIPPVPIPEDSAISKYPNGLFVLNQVRIDAVREPHGLESLFFSRRPEQVTGAVSRAMGIQASYISIDEKAKPTVKIPSGEETTYALPIPQGYALCAARVNVISVVPASGDKASVLSASVSSTEAGAYTWTPKRGPFEGRSWVEADIQLLGIQPAYLKEFQDKGICGKELRGQVGLAECKGTSCKTSKHGDFGDIGKRVPEIRTLPTLTWNATAKDRTVWSAEARPVQFASPPIPDISELKKCRTNAGTSEAGFYECMASKALPAEYRVVTSCVKNNGNDSGRALICSTGRADLMDAYDRTKKVQACAANAKNDVEVALCLGEQTLGHRELHYARCFANNRNDLAQAASCGLSLDLTPEQQIALSCAIKTGGVPKAFAACTGGRLFQREVNKCWDHGIATEQGCFGPNNEFRKYWNSADDTIRTAFGDSNDIYKTFKFMKENVWSPGPTHDFVRAVNTVHHDLRYGIGPGNDIMKTGQAAGQAITTVVETVGGAFESIGEAIGVDIDLSW